MNKTIFYVDDSAAELCLMEISMERQGISLITASGLHEACVAFDHQTTSLAVLDWNLHDGTGVDVARHIRRQKQNFPLVFLSGLLDQKKLSLANAFAPELVIEKDTSLNYMRKIAELAHSI